MYPIRTVYLLEACMAYYEWLFQQGKGRLAGFHPGIMGIKIYDSVNKYVFSSHQCVYFNFISSK